MSQEPISLPIPDPSGEITVPSEVTTRSGFGAGFAVLWCFAYLGVTQLLAGLICAAPLFIGAALLEKKPLANADATELTKDPKYVAIIMASLMFSHCAGFAFGWFMLRWRVGKVWKRRIALTRGPSRLHLALILIGIPSLLAMATVVDAGVSRIVPSIEEISQWFGLKINFDGLKQMLDLFAVTPLPIAIFAVAVLPAINEEFWCRGFLGFNLGARYSVIVTVTITSILFGFLHLEPRQGTGAAILGVAIHFAYLATRSLWVAIGLHFANNAIAVIHLNKNLNLPILQPYELLLEREPLLFALGSCAMFGAIVYALWQTRSQLKQVDFQSISWQPKSPSGAEVPPPDCGITIHQESLSPLSLSLVIVGALIFAGIISFA